MKVERIYIVTDPAVTASKLPVVVATPAELPGIIALAGLRWASAAFYTEPNEAFIAALGRWTAARRALPPVAEFKAHLIGAGGAWTFAVLDAYDRANGGQLRAVSAAVGRALPKR